MKPRFRITYRMETYVSADSEEEAKKLFEDLTNEELSTTSGFVEVVSVDIEE
jgi:hypothetical protein